MHTLKDLLLKGLWAKMQTGSAAPISEQPQSLLLLKSIGKALQVKGFSRRNWTPIKIRIVSKLVSSFGTGSGSRTHTNLSTGT